MNVRNKGTQNNQWLYFKQINQNHATVRNADVTTQIIKRGKNYFAESVPKCVSVDGAYRSPVVQRPGVAGNASIDLHLYSTPKQLNYDLFLNNGSSVRTEFNSDFTHDGPPSGIANSAATGTSTNFFSSEDGFKKPLPVKHSSQKSSRSVASGTPRKQISTRTPKSSSSNESDSNHTIVAITEGRGVARGEVGIAAIDVKRPYLILCQISDSQTYVNTLRKINILNPVEILIPSTFYDGTSGNKLFQLVNEHFKKVTMTSVQRRHFNDAHGLQQIQRLCLAEYSSVELAVFKKFYALAAMNAILKYVEFSHSIIFAPKSVRFDYQGVDNIMFIDLDTAQKLELVLSQNAGLSTANNSLFSILNNCSTIGGQRRLRALILQPSCDITEIEERLYCVEELIRNIELFGSLKAVLPKFYDVEQLLCLCTQSANLKDNPKSAEIMINYAIMLKTALESVSQLQNALESAQTETLYSIRECLDDMRYKWMLSRIRETISEDSYVSKGFAMAQFQRCFAIRVGLNGLLDVARSAYSEIMEDFNEIVNNLATEYRLPLTVRTYGNKGTVIHMQLGKFNSNFNIKDLPRVFIQVQKYQSSVTMTTRELLFYKERMNHLLQEIQMSSSVIIFDMLQEMRDNIGCLYKLCENVAEVDLLMSFAQISYRMNFIRPTFVEKFLDVKSSRHPILDSISSSRPIPNDIQVSIDHNFSIITGPNMGGKSVYIRQVALLQIMAQIGCYVPAEEAKFRITDRLFSRIGYNDSIECNASTFIFEVKEMQYILNSLTSNSLVIIDELCRGTSTEEGASIAWAISEQLLASKAFIFFTTHFVYLTKLQDIYTNVRNYHFDCLEDHSDTFSRLIYTHRLVPGVIQLEHYGLRLAKYAAIPKVVLNNSIKLAKKLSLEWKATSITDNDNRTDKEIDNVALKLLEMLDNGTLTLSNVRDMINYVIKENLINPDDLKVSNDETVSEIYQARENDSNMDYHYSVSRLTNGHEFRTFPEENLVTILDEQAVDDPGYPQDTVNTVEGVDVCLTNKHKRDAYQFDYPHETTNRKEEEDVHLTNQHKNDAYQFGYSQESVDRNEEIDIHLMNQHKRDAYQYVCPHEIMDINKEVDVHLSNQHKRDTYQFDNPKEIDRNVGDDFHLTNQHEWDAYHSGYPQEMVDRNEEVDVHLTKQNKRGTFQVDNILSASVEFEKRIETNRNVEFPCVLNEVCQKKPSSHLCSQNQYGQSVFEKKRCRSSLANVDRSCITPNQTIEMPRKVFSAPYRLGSKHSPINNRISMPNGDCISAQNTECIASLNKDCPNMVSGCRKRTVSCSGNLIFDAQQEEVLEKTARCTPLVTSMVEDKFLSQRNIETNGICTTSSLHQFSQVDSYSPKPEGTSCNNNSLLNIDYGQSPIMAGLSQEYKNVTTYNRTVTPSTSHYFPNTAFAANLQYADKNSPLKKLSLQLFENKNIVSTPTNRSANMSDEYRSQSISPCSEVRSILSPKRCGRDSYNSDSFSSLRSDNISSSQSAVDLHDLNARSSQLSTNSESSVFMEKPATRFTLTFNSAGNRSEVQSTSFSDLFDSSEGNTSNPFVFKPALVDFESHILQSILKTPGSGKCGEKKVNFSNEDSRMVHYYEQHVEDVDSFNEYF